MPMLLPITCADFERAGLWDTGDCCQDCHQHPTGATMVPATLRPNADGTVPTPKVPIEVCCSHAALRTHAKADVAAAIAANRRHWSIHPDFAFAPALELPLALQGPPIHPQ